MVPTLTRQQAGFEGNDTRYILITQCLQNDFFLKRDCKLCLPVTEATKLLVGQVQPNQSSGKSDGSLHLERGYPSKGPLGRFLEASIGLRGKRENGNGILHVINIRDWHSPSTAYDQERKAYGPHCEAGSWGADYIQGLEQYLDPARKKRTSQEHPGGEFFSEGSVRVYHIQSDSVFDFRPLLKAGDCPSEQKKFRASELEKILDILLTGSTHQVDELAKVLIGQTNKPIEELVQEVNQNPQSPPPAIYMAVIGVYTDIKVKILLASLRTRYCIPNLAVSDTLTASPSLERHLGALDFASKVLSVEVIHGLNNLLLFLGRPPSVHNEAEIIAADRFSDYATYFQDKQNLLAYEARKLQEYVGLTQQRAERVYSSIRLANQLLIGWGSGFLVLTLIGVILYAIWPGRFDWKLPLVTGGLSLLQLVSAFFWRPMADMQKNLTNLATFRMILESHSLKTALARFHLTTPQTLRDNIQTNAEAASMQVLALQDQIRAIENIELCDYRALKELGFGADESIQKTLNAEAPAQPTTPALN